MTALFLLVALAIPAVLVLLVAIPGELHLRAVEAHLRQADRLVAAQAASSTTRYGRKFRED